MKESKVDRLRQKIVSYPLDRRRLLMALACAPWQLYFETVQAVVKALGFSLQEGDELICALNGDEFFDEKIGRVSRYCWGRAVFSDEGLAACLLEMTKPDVTAKALANAYAVEHDELASTTVTAEAARWDALLLAMATDNPLQKETDEAFLEGAEDKLMEAWIHCVEKDEKRTFLSSLPTRILDHVAFYVVWPCMTAGGPAAKARELVKKLAGYPISEQVRDEQADWLVFNHFLEEGHPEKRLREMRSGSQYEHLLRAVLSLQSGDAAGAMKAARKAMKERRYEDISYFCSPFENLIYALALYADRQTPSTRKVLETILKKSGTLEPAEVVLSVFAAAATHAEEGEPSSRIMPNAGVHEIALSVVEAAAFALHRDHLTCGREPGSQQEARAEKLGKDYAVFRQLWLAAAHASSPELPSLKKSLGMAPLFAAERRIEVWERVLHAMIDEAETANRSSAGGDGEAAGPSARIYYLLNMDEGVWKVTPRLQKTNGRKWTAGRDIPLSEFAACSADGMTDKDREVAGAVHAYNNWNRRIAHELEGARAVMALAGCPRVFNAANPEERLEIVKTQPQIVVQKKGGSYNVKLSTEDASRCLTGGGIVCSVRGPKNGRIEITEITDEVRGLAAGFKKAGPLPEAAGELLTKLLERLSVRLPVMSELLQHSDKMEKQKSSSVITLRIQPADAGRFEVCAVVRPLAASDVVCEPGKGLEYLAVNVDGRSVQVARSLAKERTNLKALEEKLAFLDDCRTQPTHWLLDVEGCLGLLNAVRGDKNAVVEWPQGEKLRVSRQPLGFENLNFSVNRMGAWLEVTGDVKVDGRTKLKIAELLAKVRSARGGFIELSDNDYVALTDALRRELETLERIAGRGKTARVSVFQSDVLSGLEENGAQLKADQAFRDLRERLAAAERFTPVVPEALKTELRDYQTDGFEWMMRLASWGAGALLADDMGLGKTVQTIAVLLARAAQGPQLVTVPASVLFNWREELARFAPALKQLILNDAEDRKAVLKKAGKGAVVLTTYGILTSEAEAVAEKLWTTAVFDEAHNIKNRETKAFKAASGVQANFRILLTGTPLQNHLSEIWALFEVAVPGLLGSYQSFVESYVLPVERDHDRTQQRFLKRIVTPFILRRTKSDVLSELPEKTEMTVKVTLSKEERALYEEIRSEAEGSLASGEINPMQAIACLLKLRQAACSAELIDPKLAIPSTKTLAFLDLTEELIAGKHRALVFSQFTSHLALIRRALDEKGVRYLYLDGATTPAERQRLVEDFEAGDMPLFLISLKAGGTGLNLTAADYVIHLDPWWNPAIEDQASDRAYRIGQERPVTIYRLIAENTVEEKILELHGTKKSLADALLEGTEMSSRLGREEILELLSLAR